MYNKLVDLLRSYNEVVQTAQSYTQASNGTDHTKLCLVVGAGLIAGTMAAPLAPLAIGLFGFSSTGVISGTVAAGMQSSIGNVAAGSLFATAQSVAAGGAFPVMGSVIAGGVSSVVTYATYLAIPRAETRINTASEQTSSAADTLQKEASAKTDAAVTQGQHDTATYVEYFDQAKSLAGAALGTAQGVLQYGAEALGSTNAVAKERAETSGILGTAKSIAASVLDTAAHYSGAAKEKITPPIEDVKATAQPHVDSATEVAQPHIDAIKVDSAKG